MENNKLRYHSVGISSMPLIQQWKFRTDVYGWVKKEKPDSLAKKSIWIISTCHSSWRMFNIHLIDVHRNPKVSGGGGGVLFLTWLELDLLGMLWESLYSGDLWTDVLTEEVQRRELELAIDLLNTRPNQPSKLWRFVYSYLNMTRPAMARHFTPSILKSVQCGEALRPLRFTHS